MGMRLHSLRVKFAIIAASIGILCFGIAAVFSNRFTSEQFEDHYREKAVLIWKHVIHDLEQGMILKDHRGILDTLQSYRTYKEVEELRVFNREGEEVFSVTPGPALEKVKETLRGGEPIHFQSVVNNQRVETHIVPLANKPACYGCHGDKEKFNGALLLSLSLEEMQKNLARQVLKYLILFGLTTLVISTVTLFGIDRLFLKPLQRLQQGAKTMERGNFGHEFPATTKDEIGDLTENFNRMARKLHGFFNELEEKNRSLTEQYLLVSRAQKEWQETFDGITDQIAVIDKDFKIQKANRAFRDYYSLPPSGPVHQECYTLFRTCFQFPCPQSRDCPHLLSIQNRKTITNEYHDTRTGRLLVLSFYPFAISEGDFAGTVFIAKDVTERKQHEVQLIMNERLAALGQMASGIAHEINNPLATIRACTEGLRSRIDQSKIDLVLFKDYLGMMDEEVNRCKGIITSMLSFVRKRTVEKKEVDLREVVEKSLDMMSFQGRLKDVELIRNYREAMPLVHGEENELRQVFLSIIGNALDAMDGEGRLTVAVDADDSTAFVKVSDTGPGIPSAIVEKIFDPFFSTKSERGGTGLGLSIANKIIKEHGGRIELVPEEMKGATFKITFPL